MSQPALAAIAALLLAGPALAAAPEVNAPRPTIQTADTVPELEQAVRPLTAPFASRNTSACGPNLPRLIAAGANPLFDRLSVETRTLILDIAVACSLREAKPEAVALIRRLEPLATTPEDVADVNQVLMIDDVRQDNPLEGARRLVRVIDLDPARVAGWWAPFINRFVVAPAVRDDAALSLALLQRLTVLDWRDEGSKTAAKNFWASRYAELLLDRGDTAGAEKALAGMVDTSLWMGVAQDRRYAPLWDRFQAAGRFDWRKSVEAELAANQARRTAEPTTLTHVYEAIGLLRQLRRYDEAIALGQTFRERIKSGETFKDGEEYANWVLNELAYALFDVGRTAEGEAVFLESIEIGENGGRSVSQRINWAEKLNVLGRPLEALAILDTLSPERSSPYGKMWTSAEVVCARSQTARETTTAELNGMRQRWEDNPAALTRALICVGLLDEAAALYIKRLQSPRYRSGALEAFNKVLPPPAPSPRQVELEKRRQAVLARPDVQAALARVGRALDIPLAGGYWGAI